MSLHAILPRIWLLLSAFVIQLGAISNTASSQPIELDGNNPARVIGQSTYTIEDPAKSINLEEIQKLFAEGNLTRSEQSNLDFGYTQGPYWIAIPLKNTSEINVTYLLSTNWPFIHALEAHLIVSGREPQIVVSRRPDSTYSDTLRTGMALASEQFIIPPLSEAMMFAKYEPFAFGFLPLSFETPRTAFEKASLNSLGFALFYSGVISAAFIFMLFVIAVRHRGGIYFMGIIIAGILINAQLDGFFFQYLWPNAPLWDRVAPFHFLLLANFASFALAGYMFREAEMKRLAKLMNILMFASLAPALGQFAINVLWMIVVGYVFLVFAMGALIYAIIVWTQILPRKRQIAFLLSIGMLVIVGAIVWSVMAGFDAINLASHSLIKLLFVVIMLSLMISYATHLTALNRNYATSLKRQLEMARKEASMNAELLQSERKFAEAQQLVAKHKHRLATTSHDLKQPIASLRLTLDAMAKSGGKEVETNVARAFDYLEDLVNDNLQEGRADFEETEDDTAEAIELDLLFETIEQMFREEAISKGIRLERKPSSLTIATEIVPFMRIVSNLVSNSVKHTLTGKVTLGSRSKPGTVLVEVSDTGPGMSEDEIHRFSTLYEKGSESDGDGLGLPICFELAGKLGMDLTITSRPGEGSIFTITVPQSPQASA